MTERLHKFMARCGVASRRASERLIREGRVCVNGRPATAPGTTVNPDEDVVTVDGHPIEPEKSFHYFLLHKPAGYVTTVRDPRGRPTVMQLAPDVGVRLYPVGRLDAPTTGLLLLTNDGDLAYKLMHPRYEVPKRYRVEVRGQITADAVERLRRGVVLEDGPTAPARVRLLQRGAGRSVFELTLVEGRNRQVRRMGKAVGFPVVALQRVGFGPVELAGLEPGRTRPLTPKELAALRRSVASRPK